MEKLAKKSGHIKQRRGHWPLELRLLYSLTKSKRFFRLVQVLFTLIHFMLYIYGVYGKILIYRTLLKQDPTGQKVLTAMNLSSDTLSLLLSVYYMLFVVTKLKQMIDFFPSEVDLDYCDENKSRRFKTILDIMHACCFVPILVNLFLFMDSVGWKMYSFYLGSDMLYRHIHAIAANYLYLAHEIVCRYLGINSKLQKLCNMYGVAHGPAVHLIALQYNSAQGLVQELVKIVKHYEKLCDYLDVFNKCFRAFMVGIFMANIFTIFYCLSFIIEFSVIDNMVPNVQNSKPYIIVLFCLLILTTMGQLGLIASVGEKLQEQAQRTLTISLKILNKLPVVKKVDTDALIEKQLNFLMDQCRSRKMCFHAGGFFSINWGILGSIISIVATYSIVIIQFLLKK